MNAIIIVATTPRHGEAGRPVSAFPVIDSVAPTLSDAAPLPPPSYWFRLTQVIEGRAHRLPPPPLRDYPSFIFFLSFVFFYCYVCLLSAWWLYASTRPGRRERFHREDYKKCICWFPHTTQYFCLLLCFRFYFIFCNFISCLLLHRR